MSTTFESNPLLDNLPKHLRQFIKNQNYELYNGIDQAVWRYVMRKNVDYLSKVAHSSYLNGLQKTGISIDNIPNMYGMNRILKEIGWAAVAVDGFIPPAAFMEFQAHNVLVIASDIRQIGHIEYTPAPDIIHEGAGHAPIIANPEYAEYLRRFGEIGAKAISSSFDYQMYEAIRHLSIVKESLSASQMEIKTAEEEVLHLQSLKREQSEMSKIRNLHWWTVEYGLIGTVESPKIYGAGLLSSIGESAWCMSDKVTKLPYSLDASKVLFDITKPQPQLFVTPDFAHLSFVLEEFADEMALRKGGIKGVEQLIESKKIGTIELSTGIQISGVFTNVMKDDRNEPVYFQTAGQTALSWRNKELIGHGIEYHKDGFGSPVGKLKGINLPIENMSPTDLNAYKIWEGQKVFLTFESGITVEGDVITGTRNLYGKIQIISFKNCTVKNGDQILFHPDWGIYDMAVGVEVVSAYSGPADVSSFDLVNHIPSEKTIQMEMTAEEISLNNLYNKVRSHRNGDTTEDLQSIFFELKNNHIKDWLLAVELFEITDNTNIELHKKIEIYLKDLMKTNKEISHLIKAGMSLV